jgi:ornithine cyclodeaminase/alanine dehydrogenase-like protein (mu-crystallin family)
MDLLLDQPEKIAIVGCGVQGRTQANLLPESVRCVGTLDCLDAKVKPAPVFPDRGIA